MNYVQLQVANDSLVSFLVCLGIGTLQAIREGKLTPDAGIWSLGAPQLWEPLIANPSIPQELIEVLQMGDELSALKDLAPDEFLRELDRLINKLYDLLVTTEDPIWRLRWLSN